MKTKFCPNCGNEIPLNEDICRYCLKDSSTSNFLSANQNQYQFGLDNFETKSIKKVKTKKPQVKQQKESPKVLEYSNGLPIRRLLLLMIVTCGLYGIYWFYRSSKFTKEQGKDVNPVLRTVLLFIPFVNLVVIYLLFRDIKNIVKTKNITFNTPINFILFIFGWILSLWSMINIQEAMNEYYRLSNPNLVEHRQFTLVEKVFMGVFILIYILIILIIISFIVMLF